MDGEAGGGAESGGGGGGRRLGVPTRGGAAGWEGGENMLGMEKEETAHFSDGLGAAMAECGFGVWGWGVQRGGLPVGPLLRAHAKAVSEQMHR